jgi:hypothetical protein
MDLNNKTKDELISELQKLQQENIALKAAYDKCLSEQNLLEEKFITATEKAKEKNRFKSDFIACMSHEIRTPLNGIWGFSEILLNEKNSSIDRLEIIKYLVQSSIQLKKTINDFFEFLFLDFGKKANISETNITEISEKIYSALKPEIITKGILFSNKNTLPTNGFIVKTDGFLIQEILTKLIMGFLDFTIGGSIEFGCCLRKASEPSEIEFYVKNTGIYIPQSKHQSIFSLSGLYHIFDTRNFVGLGSDLFVAKSYVELLGGTIRLESEEGKGTTFYFTVPDTNPT